MEAFASGHRDNNLLFVSYAFPGSFRSGADKIILCSSKRAKMSNGKYPSPMSSTRG